MNFERMDLQDRDYVSVDYVKACHAEIDRLTAELDRLTAAAKMVEQMEILAREDISLGEWYIPESDKKPKATSHFTFSVGGYLGKSDSFLNAFQLALTSFLSSLPDPQRSELAKKLGVEE